MILYKTQIIVFVVCFSMLFIFFTPKKYSVKKGNKNLSIGTKVISILSEPDRYSNEEFLFNGLDWSVIFVELFASLMIASCTLIINGRERFLRRGLSSRGFPPKDFITAISNICRREIEKTFEDEFDEFNPEHLVAFTYLSRKIEDNIDQDKELMKDFMCELMKIKGDKIKKDAS